MLCVMKQKRKSGKKKTQERRKAKMKKNEEKFIKNIEKNVNLTRKGTVFYKKERQRVQQYNSFMQQRLEGCIGCSDWSSILQTAGGSEDGSLMNAET